MLLEATIQKVASYAASSSRLTMHRPRLPPLGRVGSGAGELTQIASAAASARAHRPCLLRLRAQAPFPPPMEGSSVEEAAGIRPTDGREACSSTADENAA
ncbi:unnamed protein product [Urochloa humidicola]